MGNNTRIILHGALLLLLLTLPPSVAAESPPCMVFAYVLDDSGDHASLIIEDTYVFGSQTIVISNCNNTSIQVDGITAASTNNKELYTYVQPGTHDITLSNSGDQITLKNVTFISSGQLQSIVRELPNDENPYSEPYTPAELDNLEIIAGIGSLFITWVIVTGFLWNLISRYQEKNYCIEVV